MTTATPAGTPLCIGDTLVGVEFEESVEEAMEHFVYNAGLDFGGESWKGKVEGGSEDGEGSIEIECTMREVEGAGIDIAQSKVNGGGCKRGGREMDGERIIRVGCGSGGWGFGGLRGGPGEELSSEEGRSRDEDKPMGGEDGGCVLWI